MQCLSQSDALLTVWHGGAVCGDERDGRRRTAALRLAQAKPALRRRNPRRRRPIQGTLRKAIPAGIADDGLVSGGERDGAGWRPRSESAAGAG